MKKHALLLSALCLISASAACATPGSDSGAPARETAELRVFAAASMQEALDQIIEQYHDRAPHAAVIPTYDSSGALKTQIQEGADCDVFLSPGQLQMDQLDASVDSGEDPSAGGRILDCILPETRRDLLENQVVLAVPEGNPKGIEGFEQLAEKLRGGGVLLAVGNSGVPVGQYTRRIFQYLGLKPEALDESGVLTYGSNVKEVAAQVSEGTVDCGIIYATDALSAGLAVVDAAPAEMCGRVVYPAAVLKNSGRPHEAQAFLDFLFSDEAAAVFESAGFIPLTQDS